MDGNSETVDYGNSLYISGSGFGRETARLVVCLTLIERGLRATDYHIPIAGIGLFNFCVFLVYFADINRNPGTGYCNIIFGRFLSPLGGVLYVNHVPSSPTIELDLQYSAAINVTDLPT